MKKLFLLAWPIALAAVSCSNEEVVSVNNDANEIKFTAVAENATRAADSYCNNALPADFDVWALATDAADNVKSYFEKVNYSKVDPATEWTATDQKNIHFWPNASGDKLNFYAMRNYGTTEWTPAGSVKLSTTFEVEDSVANQKDLIYAVATGVTKPASGTQTTLNFRHALSQIVFKAKNTNKNLAVEITHIAIVNVAKSGTCSLPTEATTTNLLDHNSNNQIDNTESGTPTATTPADNTVCKWAALTTQDKDYWVATETCKMVGTVGDVHNLTNSVDAEGSTRDFSKSLLLIPQKLTGAGISTSNTPKNIWGASGSMLAVKCKIWNLNTADTSDDNDVLLFDSVAYIPLSATWEAGKKYIYTLIFGKANGGYDGDGKDILVPITFNVTVDDFTPVVEKDVYVDNVERP